MDKDDYCEYSFYFNRSLMNKRLKNDKDVDYVYYRVGYTYVRNPDKYEIESLSIISKYGTLFDKDHIKFLYRTGNIFTVVNLYNHGIYELPIKELIRILTRSKYLQFTKINMLKEELNNGKEKMV